MTESKNLDDSTTGNTEDESVRKVESFLSESSDLSETEYCNSEKATDQEKQELNSDESSDDGQWLTPNTSIDVDGPKECVTTAFGRTVKKPSYLAVYDTDMCTQL